MGEGTGTRRLTPHLNECALAKISGNATGQTHRDSPVRNVQRKVVSTAQKETISKRDYPFFAAVLSDVDLGDVDTRKV